MYGLIRQTKAEDSNRANGLHAVHAGQDGEDLVSYLSPDLVEMRVNSVAGSMLRSRFTCCSSPCTASGAL